MRTIIALSLFLSAMSSFAQAREIQCGMYSISSDGTAKVKVSDDIAFDEQTSGSGPIQTLTYLDNGKQTQVHVQAGFVVQEGLQGNAKFFALLYGQGKKEGPWDTASSGMVASVVDFSSTTKSPVLLVRSGSFSASDSAYAIKCFLK